MPMSKYFIISTSAWEGAALELIAQYLIRNYASKAAQNRGAQQPLDKITNKRRTWLRCVALYAHRFRVS
jgi:hypothetical protein